MDTCGEKDLSVMGMGAIIFQEIWANYSFST